MHFDTLLTEESAAATGRTIAVVPASPMTPSGKNQKFVPRDSIINGTRVPHTV